MAFDRSVADNLIRIREAKGLNQSRLARMTGLSKMTMSRLEGAGAGQELLMHHARALAPVLGVSPEHLLFPHKYDQQGKEKAKSIAIHYDEGTLPAFIVSASKRLAEATTFAEILEVRTMADREVMNKKQEASFFKKLKGAHDETVKRARQAQADALLIMREAQKRLAKEVTSAQDRGEIGQHGGNRVSKVGDDNLAPPTFAELGISKEEVHEGRLYLEADAIDPEATRRVFEEQIESGKDPTKTAMREVSIEVARRSVKKRQEADDDHIAARRHLRAVMDMVQACMTFSEAIDLDGLGDVVSVLDNDELESVKKARDSLDEILRQAGKKS